MELSEMEWFEKGREAAILCALKLVERRGLVPADVPGLEAFDMIWEEADEFEDDLALSFYGNAYMPQIDAFTEQWETLKQPGRR